MKKILTSLFILAGLVAMGMVLSNNKAKSEAKVKAIVERPFTVSVTRATTTDIGDSLVFIGSITPDREVAIASETMGKIRSISAELGSYKGRGAVIATVDGELKRAAVMAAEANYEKARKDLERFQQVQVENALPDQQIDNARLAVQLAEANLITARRQLRDTRITAPFSGVITARSAEVGTMVQPCMVIATLVDVSTLKVRLNVPEKDIVTIRVGDDVTVTTDVHPGTIFGGRVSNIGVRGDDAHTYPVDVTISNRAGTPLKSGMFTRVRFRGASTRPALTIPRAAIVGSVKSPKVYVLAGKTVKLRSIGIGEQSGSDVEVLSGLKEGETVVLSGHNNLRDGMTVEVAR